MTENTEVLENIEVIDENSIQYPINKVAEMLNRFEDTKEVLKSTVKKYELVELVKENKKQIENAEKDWRNKRYKLQNVEKDITKHLNTVKKTVKIEIAEMIDNYCIPNEKKFRDPLDKWENEASAEKQRLAEIEEKRVKEIKDTIYNFEIDNKSFINQCKTSLEVSQLVIGEIGGFDFQEFKLDYDESVQRIKDYRLKVMYELKASERAEELEKENAKLKAELEKARKKEALEELESKIDNGHKFTDEEINEIDPVDENLSNNDYEEVGIDENKSVTLPEPSEKPISEVLENEKFIDNHACIGAKNISEAIFPTPEISVDAIISIEKIHGNFYLNFKGAKILIDVNEMPFKEEIKEWCESEISKVSE